MNCNEFRKYVSDLICGDIEQPKAQVLLKHALECNECDNLLKQLKNMTTLLKSIGTNSVPEDCWPSVRLRITDKQRRPLYSVFMWKYVAAPAAIAMLLAGYMFMTPRDSSPQLSASSNSATYTDYINIHAGAGANQPLSDSDVYWVAAGMQDVGDR